MARYKNEPVKMARYKNGPVKMARHKYEPVKWLDTDDMKCFSPQYNSKNRQSFFVREKRRN